MVSTKTFTGVGHRVIPMAVRSFLFEAGAIMSANGYKGYSGIASGSDTCFQKGCESVGGEFLALRPFSGYGETSVSLNTITVNVEELQNYQEARYIASLIHPIWKELSYKVQSLHTRNVYEVIGLDLESPTDIFLMYAKVSSATTVEGGTNTAYQLAREFNIKTLNFFKPLDRILFKKDFK